MPQHDDPHREEYDVFTPMPTSTSPTGAGPEDEDNSEGAKPVDATEADGKRTLVGYPVVWGAVSSIRRDGFRHRYQKGVIHFTTPVLALWSHDLSTPLASSDNATLALAEDDYGVKAVITLDTTTDSDNAFIRVKNKLVSGMSFGGRRIAYDRTPDPKVINVTSFICDEVSVTIAPGMTETTIVTGADAPDMMKEIAARQQKNQLAKIQLAMLKPRQSFGAR